MKKKLNLLISTLCLFGIVGCNQEPKILDPEIIHRDVITDIELDSYYYTLFVGETYQLAPFFRNVNNPSIVYSYESSDSSIASVSSNGLVTANALGEALITIKYEDFSTLVKITVKEEIKDDNVLNFNVITDSIQLYVLDTYKIKYTATYNNVIVTPSLSYTVANPSYLSVDGDGVISAKVAGTTTITVKATYKEKVYEDTLSVTVVSNTAQFVINNLDKEIVVGETAPDISFTLIDTKNEKTTFKLSELTSSSVSNATLAEISGDKLVGLAKGNVTLSVRLEYKNRAYTLDTIFRVREKYKVTYNGTGDYFYVKDGDLIDNVPVNPDSKFVFESWEYDNLPFNEPVEQDMNLDVIWSISTINYSRSLLGAELLYLNAEKPAGHENDPIAYQVPPAVNQSNILPGWLDYSVDSVYEEILGHYAVNYQAILPKVNFSKFIGKTIVFLFDSKNPNSNDSSYIGLDKDNNVSTKDGGYIIFTDITTNSMTLKILGSIAEMHKIITDSDIILGKVGCPLHVRTTFNFGRSFQISYPKVYDSFSYLGYFSGTYLIPKDPNVHPRVIEVGSNPEHTQPGCISYYVDVDYDGVSHKTQEFKMGLPAIRLMDYVGKKVSMQFSSPFSSCSEGAYLGFNSTNKLSAKTGGSIEFSDITATSFKISLIQNQTVYFQTVSGSDAADYMKGFKGFELTYTTTYQYGRNIQLTKPVVE